MVQIYLLIGVGILAVALGVRPRPRSRAAGFARFGVVAALGVALVVNSFHAAGRVDRLVVTEDRAHVLEVHPERLLGAETWTTLELASGERVDATAPPSAPDGGEAAPEEAALRVPRTLRGRIERRASDGRWVEVGPELEQPLGVATSSQSAIAAAFDEVYAPETLYVARFERDGTLSWRLDGETLGLAEGRLRRSARTSDGDLVLVFDGFAVDRSWFERLSMDTHIVVARVDAELGRVRWRARF